MKNDYIRTIVQHLPINPHCSMSEITQRTQLQAAIWRIADDVRGAVDGWDFKQFVLGALFYRYISENFAAYMEGGNSDKHYAEYADSQMNAELVDTVTREKGYFIYPSQLFAQVVGTAESNPNLNTELAAILAFSAIQNNDKIGVIFFSDRIEKYIPPKKGRKHILYIIHEMLDFKPESKRTNVAAAIEYLTRVMKRRCIAFVVSDFYADNSFQKELQIANSKHDVVAIQVYDQRAKTLPNVGLMKVMDAETGHEMFIDTASAKLRRAHTEYWTERMNTLRTTFAQSNVDWVSVATNEDYVKALMLLFMQRGQNR